MLKQHNSIKFIYISLAGFSALMIGVGIGRFCYPPLIPSIIEHHWFSVAQGGYLEATNLAGYLLGAAFTWKIAQKIREVHLIRIAITLVILSFIGCSYRFPFIFYSLFRLMEGVSGAIIMILVPPFLLSKVPTSDKGLANGIIFSGLGAGLVLTGLLTPMLINQGLSFPWYFYATFSVFLFIIFYKVWVNPLKTSYNSNVSPSSKKTVKITAGLLGLMFIYACNALAFAPFTVFWVDYLERGLQIGMRTANIMWLVLGIGCTIAPIGSGIIADRVGVARSLRISLFIEGIFIILPGYFISILSLILSSFFAGAMVMTITSLVVVRVTELTDASHQKQVWGWMTLIFSLMYALGAYFFTFLFAQTGSFHLLFIIGGGIPIICGILNQLFYLQHKYVLFIRRKNNLLQKEDERPIIS